MRAWLRRMRPRSAPAPQAAGRVEPGDDVRAYSTGAIVIHWITAGALALAIALGWRMTHSGGAERASALALHQSIGITILLLTVLRIVWRVSHRPAPAPAIARWEQRLANGTHLAFYVLLAVIPLLGWLALSSGSSGGLGRLFGLVPWPAVPGVAGLTAVGDAAQAAHRVLAYSLCALLALHVAGAVKHHLKDPREGLVRILPRAQNLVGWRTVSIACGLAVLFVLAGGYADRLLPGRWHLVQFDRAGQAAALIDPRRSPVFASVMQPILNEKCVSCHGEGKQKGGLRLDSFASVIRGGENGKIVVPQSSEESEIVRRIMMPVSQGDAMPPAGRPGLTPAEGQLVLWWIGAGADDTATIVAANPPPLVENILRDLGVRNESPVFAKAVAPPDAKVLARLRASGFQAQFLYAEGGFLKARQRFDRGQQALRVDVLKAVADQLVWLDLSGGNVPAGQFAALEPLRKLQRLNLAHTQARDADIQRLSGLPFLETLNLYGTAVTDGIWDSLSRMPSLTSVYLSETGVTSEGVEQFRKDHPGIHVVWQPAVKSASGAST